MPLSTTTTEERQPFHLHHHSNTSSSSSVVTIQRPASIGASRSNSRPQLSVSHGQTANGYISTDAATPLATVLTTESRQYPSASHSRSNSASGIKEGFGDFNRWSQSTSSSKISVAHKRSDSFTRRMSFGGAGSFAFGVPSSKASAPQEASSAQSPKRLKSSTTDVPNQTVISVQTRDTPNSSTSLPPIVALPPLLVYRDKSPPLTAEVNSASTIPIHSSPVRSTVPEYFSKAWNRPFITQELQKPRDALNAPSPLEGLPSKATLPAKVAVDGTSTSKQAVGRRADPSRGHSRNRSQVTKGSSGTTSSKERVLKQPSQKAMLSKALQKANTAVLLDNAQNFEGAMQAYSEACSLLQQVMLRSSGEEDKKKLEAIRNTYATRITELEKIAPTSRIDDGKALPARPESNDYQEAHFRSTSQDSAIIGTGTAARYLDEDQLSGRPGRKQVSQGQRREDHFSPLHFDHKSYNSSPQTADQLVNERSFATSPMQERTEVHTLLGLPMEREHMPPPLSPRRPPAEEKDIVATVTTQQLVIANEGLEQKSLSPEKTHRRVASNESMSWLDTIDESAGSSVSSVHSRTSSLGVRRKHIRAASGATEAEFDAALDAAVEAAYDDGFEPDEASTSVHEVDSYDDQLVANVRRKVELAKERVRQTERETAIQMAHERERLRLTDEKKSRHFSINDEYNEDESEEEERMLEEMTRGYVMDDFEFGLHSKSALPRESDSSGFSGRTWNSSIGSNPTTAGTSLSAVTAKIALPDPPLPLKTKSQPPNYPPPAQALPPPPPAARRPLSRLSQSAAAAAATATSQGVRSRRLSGQNAKQLKIETVARQPSIEHEPKSEPLMPPPKQAMLPQPPHTAGIVPQPQQIEKGSPTRSTVQHYSRQTSPPFPGSTVSNVVSVSTPTLVQRISFDSDNNGPILRSGSPARSHSRSGLRKNFSSSSLRAMKNRNLSISNPEYGSDASPITPMSGLFAGTTTNREAAGKLPAMPALPTAIATSYKEKPNGITTGGYYLFDGDILSPESPRSLDAMDTDGPIPLEPCPTGSLLRPFWLMRAFYQTIAHPRGGYLSTKLFVPKDVWSVKGVKIRNIEDKIACCDYLSAALQKLSKVDTCDADAVLDEMQALETVLEQMQVTLSRKLGNEVGLQGSGVLFKDATTVGDTDAGGATLSKAASQSGKSSFSWRRLRSKNSGVGLATSFSAKPPVGDGLKEGPTMASLPMTSLNTIRFAKRDVSQIQFSGPNANYMGALAKLFDAAQVLDQIARQAEDPGLRHADKTQVGLELSTRHAAEFFGFYICRFVLADISLLLDKFIKRGSEWVLV